MPSDEIDRMRRLSPEEQDRLIRRVIKSALWQLNRRATLLDRGMAVPDLALAEDPETKVPEGWVYDTLLCAYVSPFTAERLKREAEEVELYFQDE